MNRYFVELAFNGKNYHGWQIQPNAITVQQSIEDALSTLLQEKIMVTGAGRTDTGVHASYFVAHFDSNRGISNKNLVFRLNRFLPHDIAIFNIYPVPSERHARFDANSRTYQYKITRIKDPFYYDFAHYLFGHLDIIKMNKAASVLYDYIDYTSFSKLHTDVKTNNCVIKKAVFEEKDHLLIFTITADRFLRNMIRAIVGTLFEVGHNKLSMSDFRKIIESKDRSKAGPSAPAKGLYLTHVGYPFNFR